MKTYFTIVFSVILFNINAQNFNWTEQNSGTSEWFNDIYFVDNQTGWAVGEKGTIVATIDGGETWTSQTSGILPKVSRYFTRPPTKAPSWRWPYTISGFSFTYTAAALKKRRISI